MEACDDRLVKDVYDNIIYIGPLRPLWRANKTRMVPIQDDSVAQAWTTIAKAFVKLARQSVTIGISAIKQVVLHSWVVPVAMFLWAIARSLVPEQSSALETAICEVLNGIWTAICRLFQTQALHPEPMPEGFIFQTQAPHPEPMPEGFLA
jgi:hypothetical protein